MNAIQCAAPTPQIEIVEQRAARRQIFGYRPPLATGIQDVHDTVHHLAHIDVATIAAPLGERNLRFDKCPFLVRQIAGIA
jgi:hypothetical protein